MNGTATLAEVLDAPDEMTCRHLLALLSHAGGGGADAQAA